MDSLICQTTTAAPASRTKIRNIMSAVYSHGIRHEKISFNPISKVHCSAKRLREPDVLTPGKFQALLRELPLRERVMVMIAGSTGLRRSELLHSVGTAWQPISAAWEWMSRLRKSCSGTQIHAPRWTSTRKQFPQTSGVRV